MKVLSSTVVFLLLLCSAAYAQVPGGVSRGSSQNMNAGHFYGKVMDAQKKGIESASVQLLQSKRDSTTHTMKDVVVSGMLTKSNGDFSLENLPVMGAYKLKISAIGFQEYTQAVKFDLKAPGSAGAGTDQLINAVDKDLGNIKLKADVQSLGEVTIVATKPQYQMAIDKKVFNVDKNIVSAGGMATDVLKNVPSVNVDVDGNVTLRNNTPQIFVDGRPTTLTMDQIPADAIESVEVITNPSAKYDASGGGGGILNIVLKKNKKVGYNGNIRLGVDSRGKANGGLDLNVRQGKFNVFASGNIRQRKSKSTGELTQSTLNDDGAVSNVINQSSNNVSSGFFGFGRAGADYFIDNRNTLSLSGSYVRGHMKNYDDYNSFTSFPGLADSNYLSNRNGYNEFNFKNYGAELSFKHNFAKSGHELTADFNYNSSTNWANQFIGTSTYYPSLTPKLPYSLQQVNTNGSNKFYTFQSDYVNPISEKSKIEAGIRGQIRDYTSVNEYYLSSDSGKTFNYLPASSSNYKFKDQVYAAYAQFSSSFRKFGYQLGLRAESSKYDGTLVGNEVKFTNKYPITLFPSAFLTYKLTDKQDLQLNFSRRVNRPTFFQLSPYLDRSDTLNFRQGNPNLRPEFTNSFELSYQNTYKGGNSFLVTAYYKHTTDLITSYLEKKLDTETSDSVFVYTYANASSSEVYGLELTDKHNITKWWDIMANFNLYNSKINGSNLEDQVQNQQWSYFAKLNTNFKLPYNFNLQLSGDYQSKNIVPASSSGSSSSGGGGGRFGGFGASTSTAQGYVRPIYGVDFAVKKDFLKNKAASITFNINDIFRTRKNDTHSVSTLRIQDYSRLRDPQIMRLTFSYRFGKMDANLFKRKNNKNNNEQSGAEMMGGQG